MIVAALSALLVLSAQNEPPPEPDPEPDAGDGDAGDGDGDGDGDPEGGGFDQEREYAGSYWGEPYCDTSDLLLPPNFDAYVRDVAPVGGSWWLSRFDENLNQRSMFIDPVDLVLIGGDGTMTTPALHITPSRVAIRVPDGASEGTFLLQRTLNASDAVVLRVEGEVPRKDAFVFGSVEQGPPTPATCYADCYEPGHFIPRSPTLLFTFAGPPVVVDAWAIVDGTVPDLTVTRPVESRLLQAGNYGALTVGQELYGDVSPDLHLQVRDPDTLELLYEGVLAEPLPQIEFTDEQGFLTDCSEFDDYADDYYYGDDFNAGACRCTAPTEHGPPAAVVLGLLAVVAFRRRRR